MIKIDLEELDVILDRLWVSSTAVATAAFGGSGDVVSAEFRDRREELLRHRKGRPPTTRERVYAEMRAEVDHAADPLRALEKIMRRTDEQLNMKYRAHHEPANRALNQLRAEMGIQDDTE